MYPKRGPFLRAADVEDLPASFDHTAINATGDIERKFICGDTDHHLIQQCEAARDITFANERTPLALPSESDQVFITETFANPCGFGKSCVRLVRLACMNGLIAYRK